MRGQTLLRSPEIRILPGPSPATEETSRMERFLNKCRIRNKLLRECMAECLGIYILILFGCGSVAQVTTTQEQKGQYLSINLGFALGTMFGVFVSRGVSGGHLNPAVSLSLCFMGRLSWVKLPFYVFSQVLGAFLGAATVALQYYGETHICQIMLQGRLEICPALLNPLRVCVDAIWSFSGGFLTVTGPTATAGIFSTYPADYLSLWGGVVDQIVGTAALLVCVLALGDPRNGPLHPGLEPILVGATVMVIGVSMGSNSGYAINPARDFGPRLFTFIAGWGGEVFKAGGGWWWVPLVATSLGAVVGTLIYLLLIEFHHPVSVCELPTSCQSAEGKSGLELDPERHTGRTEENASM
ncbi:aquaporin-10b isoform X1 [Genypterus blacodes]|uniref:aquaporin-10b isoform X1 n=1 Tax=Genypterus blacodes TaxID=154954 RepID=UPI003F75D1FD